MGLPGCGWEGETPARSPWRQRTEDKQEAKTPPLASKLWLLHPSHLLLAVMYLTWDSSHQSPNTRRGPGPEWTSILLHISSQSNLRPALRLQCPVCRRDQAKPPQCPPACTGAILPSVGKGGPTVKAPGWTDRDHTDHCRYFLPGDARPAACCVPQSGPKGSTTKEAPASATGAWSCPGLSKPTNTPSAQKNGLWVRQG